jgi:hypothetical protein
MNKLKGKKLKHVICIRLADEDNQKINFISQQHNIDISKLIRKVLCPYLSLVREK